MKVKFKEDYFHRRWSEGTFKLWLSHSRSWNWEWYSETSSFPELRWTVGRDTLGEILADRSPPGSGGKTWGGGASRWVINTRCIENRLGFLTAALVKGYCLCQLAGVRTAIGACESSFKSPSPFGIERVAAVLLFQVLPGCQPAGKTTGQCNPTNKHFIDADWKQICLCLMVIHWSVNMGRHVPGESEKLCLRSWAGKLASVRVTGENALTALLLLVPVLLFNQVP